jgi:hypothetical protein
VIGIGTLLGGRYLIEGERPGDHDGVPSWWAVDRQLHRRGAVVVLAGGRPLDVSRTARVDYAGRLLDGGEHEGEAYLVIRTGAVTDPVTRVDPASFAPGAAAPGPPSAGPPRSPGAVPPTVVHSDRTSALPLPPPPAAAARRPDPGARAADHPPPVVHGDRTDATIIQPLPATAGAPAGNYAAPLPPAGRAPLSNRTLVRGGALIGAAFVLGAGSVIGVAILASPEPSPPVGPVGAVVGDVGDAQPTRTLPSQPAAPPTIPEEAPTTAATTTTRHGPVPPPPGPGPTPPTTDETSPTTRKPRPTTTRRRRPRGPFAAADTLGG